MMIYITLKSKEKPPIPTEQTVIGGMPGAIRSHGLWSRSGEL